LQEFIFMALVAKTEIDLIPLEKGEMTEEAIVKELINAMESYTNGGLVLIKEKLEENASFFIQTTSFLTMIMDIKDKKVTKKKKEVTIKKETATP